MRDGVMVRFEGLRSIVIDAEAAVHVSCDRMFVDGSIDPRGASAAGSLPPSIPPEAGPSAAGIVGTERR